MMLCARLIINDVTPPPLSSVATNQLSGPQKFGEAKDILLDTGENLSRGGQKQRRSKIISYL